MGYVIDALGQVGKALVTAEEIIVILSAALGALAMFFVLNYFYEVVAYWRIFKKAGESGWKSLIPVYNSYIRYRLAWRPLWFWISGALLACSFALGMLPLAENVASTVSSIIGVAGTLIHLVSNFRLGRVFGRGVLFSLALAVFPPLFTMILGFGGSQYQGLPHPAAAASDEGAGQ